MYKPIHQTRTTNLALVLVSEATSWLVEYSVGGFGPAQVLTTPMWISTTDKDIRMSVQSASPIFINAVSLEYIY